MITTTPTQQRMNATKEQTASENELYIIDAGCGNVRLTSHPFGWERVIAKIIPQGIDDFWLSHHAHCLRRTLENRICFAHVSAFEVGVEWELPAIAYVADADSVRLDVSSQRLMTPTTAKIKPNADNL